MGLDALGDAYFVAKDGEELNSAVNRGKPERLRRVLEQNSEYFSGTTIYALKTALKQSNRNELTAILLGDLNFLSCLPYRTLVEAIEYADSLPDAELKNTLTNALNRINRSIEQRGAVGYLRYLMSDGNVVHSASGRGIRILDPSDVFIYAVESGNMEGLKALIEVKADEQYLDMVTLRFVKGRLEKKPESIRKDMEPLIDYLAKKKGDAYREEELKNISKQLKAISEERDALKKETIGLLLRKEQLEKQRRKSK